MNSFNEWRLAKEIESSRVPTFQEWSDWKKQEGVLDTVIDLERGWVKGGVVGLGKEIGGKVKNLLPKKKVK